MAMISIIVVLLAFSIVTGNSGNYGPEIEAIKQKMKDYFTKLVDGYVKTGRSATYLEVATQYIDLAKDPETLLVKYMGSKGRGVITTKAIRKGSFVCEYAGELLTEEEGEKRAIAFSLQKDRRIYLYFFEYNGKKWLIDSTEESSRVGRLINHRLKFPNVESFPFEYRGIPRLVLVAMRDIFPFEELTLDYNMGPSNIKENPWLEL